LPNLTFNFSALQVYEVLLVLVGIILARRRIWYDSMLLLGLENLLVLVPFILVTQALMIGNGVALTLCLAGTGMVVLRFVSLRKFIPELNMPLRLLGFGLIVLAGNLVVPVYFRWLLDDASSEWEPCNQWLWLAGLPVLQLLANFLPKPQDRGAGMQRSWLPIGMYELWVAGTAVHLWCIAYVGKVSCTPYLLAPLLWAFAWMVNHRIEDFSLKPDKAVQAALFCTPILASFLGAGHEHGYVLLILTSLNIAIYGGLYARNNRNLLALQLLVGSVAVLLGAVPSALGTSLPVGRNPISAIAVALGAFVILQAFVSRHPLRGFCGAVVAGMVPAYLGVEAAFHLSIQAGLVFLLVHSLRWADSDQRATAALRTWTVVAWAAHSILFAHYYPGPAWKVLFAAAVLVWLGYLAVRLFTGGWAARIVPVGAAVCFLATPTDYILRKVLTSPAGLLAIAASFLLFALGTLLAFTKPHWSGMRQE
jgi:hypothetical protein